MMTFDDDPDYSEEEFYRDAYKVVEDMTRSLNDVSAGLGMELMKQNRWTTKPDKIPNYQWVKDVGEGLPE